MKTIILMAAATVLLAVNAGSAQAQDIVQQGVAANEVKRCLDDFASNGLKVSYIKANQQPGGKITYDFVFSPDDGSNKRVSWGLSAQDYRQMDSDLQKIGYTRVCSNAVFVGGGPRYCALWVKPN